MSEWHVQVVKLGKVGKHPNADALEITQVHDGYPCIIRSGSFKEGDIAVYVPVDSIVPLEDARFGFLSDAIGKKHQRIKAKKLRGIFSMGLLVPADPDMQPGDIVHERMGITKWDPEETVKTSGECVKDPGGLPVYTDIEGYRKYKNLLQYGTEVVVTEKLHGANSRFAWHNDIFWAGSHKQFKKEDPNNMWWRIVELYGLRERLALHPEHIFYGETYGQVQKGYPYDIPAGSIGFRVFDVFDIKDGRYLNWSKVEEMCEDTGLLTVPVLYQGPWKEELTEMRNGKTTLGGKHTREGIVVKPLVETYEPHIGRLILKFVGENYLLSKE